MRSIYRLSPAELESVKRRLLTDKVLGLIAAGIFFTLPFLILTYWR